MTGIIYIATCKKTGKYYVGQTTKTLKQRRYQHEWNAEQGAQTHFARALSIYGLDNFLWCILRRIKAKTEQELKKLLNETEIKYITALNSNGINGYNLTEGGEGCLPNKLISRLCANCEKVL